MTVNKGTGQGEQRVKQGEGTFQCRAVAAEPRDSDFGSPQTGQIIPSVRGGDLDLVCGGAGGTPEPLGVAMGLWVGCEEGTQIWCGWVLGELWIHWIHWRDLGGSGLDVSP